jgi:hypothetical protein
MSKQDPSQYLLTPEEIDALRPPDDGYSYYRSYGEAVQNALLQKLADKVYVKVPIIPEHTGEDGFILEGGFKYVLLSEVLRGEE